MSRIPRVALFADTFHETNGAANVIRRLQAFAQENKFPFLCFRAGEKTAFGQEHDLSTLELERSRLSFPIDGELKFDPVIWRHKNLVKQTLLDFKPDIIHVTGLNDISQLGFFFAHFLNVPAVASWHTNTHEYAARRFASFTPWLPSKLKNALNRSIERGIFCGLMKLYFLAQMQLAPNEELVEVIRRETRRPTFLMTRGVDTAFLTPEKRQRSGMIDEKTFVLGYVGRLRPEKNVRFLREIDKALQREKIANHSFLIVGDGGESDWLRRNLSRSVLTGTLHGEELARAYANMDLFVFPSRTDAFGNVVLEAMAAGVPPIVLPDNGPKFLIEHNRNGYIASGDDDFIKAIIGFIKQSETLDRMRVAARDSAHKKSWQSVFEGVYENYRLAMTLDKKVRVQ